MQVLRSNGNEDDVVRSLTSATEMLPTTFDELSSIARDDTPSLWSNVRASAKGLSPLSIC